MENSLLRIYIERLQTEAHVIETILNGFRKQLLDVSFFIDNCVQEYIESNKIIGIAGNGGSAAEADHFVGELIGRFYKNRQPFPIICFNSGIATPTAISNDFGYSEVIKFYIEAFKNNLSGIILLSTSGNSENLIKAAEFAKLNNIRVLSLLGKDGGKLKELSDMSFIVPSDDTPIIQQIHLSILHSIAEQIENKIINLK